ncbi:MAG: DUF3656 domain-containing U32 family peptidase [Christensenellales bacterium]|jgi:putative protease
MTYETIENRRPEVLAPVGGKEQLYAAVRCGADAVYLGAKGFNARRNAENFGDMGLAEAVSYCHGRGVNVHVTVNTLVMDTEEDELFRTLKSVAQSGADAVIVQDLWVAKLLRQCCPDIAMHASTQMAVHNEAGLRALKELGFSRVVLARELSLDEIKNICDLGLMEVETFIHGALCMSVSGACYLSSMLGGRSGNRGLCAQPCRLNFRHGEREYALSLKDMSYIQHVQGLMKAGVSSFKIEGRMKHPEYVAAAVTACRAAIDGEKPDMETLQAVFSRSGFTDGHLTGKRDLSMFGVRRKEDVEASAAVLGKLAGLYRNELSRIPVDMTLDVFPGKPAMLRVSDGKNSVLQEGEVPFEAQNRPMDIDYARRSLEKTGGTPFVLAELNGKIAGDMMMAGSQLGKMRREALEKLLALRSETRPHAFAEPAFAEKAKRDEKAPAELWVMAQSYDQISGAEMDGVQRLILPLREIIENPKVAQRFGDRLAAELPALIFPAEEESLKEDIKSLRGMGVKAALAENIGALMLAKEAGLKAIGGHGLNILNTAALEEYARFGLDMATVSFELNGKDIAALGGRLERGAIGYGYLPLMRFRSCPVQGKGKGCKGCGGLSTLKDRKNEEFPVICSGNYSTMLNSLPLYVFDRNMKGLDFMTAYFTIESQQECKAILAACKEGAPAAFKRTRGLYHRELQ